jgi:sorbitol-specific phosphotransferase system component IIC
VIGILGSLVGALGVLVVLQQRGQIFPTLSVEIVTLVIGLLVGIAVPSLARLIAVRRINRVLSRRSHEESTS